MISTTIVRVDDRTCLVTLEYADGEYVSATIGAQQKVIDLLGGPIAWDVQDEQIRITEATEENPNTLRDVCRAALVNP